MKFLEGPIKELAISEKIETIHTHRKGHLSKVIPFKYGEGFTYTVSFMDGEEKQLHPDVRVKYISRYHSP